jgi:hypothetical protein
MVRRAGGSAGLAPERVRHGSSVALRTRAFDRCALGSGRVMRQRGVVQVTCHGSGTLESPLSAGCRVLATRNRTPFFTKRRLLIIKKVITFADRRGLGPTTGPEGELWQASNKALSRDCDLRSGNPESAGTHGRRAIAQQRSNSLYYNRLCRIGSSAVQ